MLFKRKIYFELYCTKIEREGQSPRSKVGYKNGRVEQSLCKRLAEGESEAFAELYDKFNERIYHYLLCQLRSVACAEDVLQSLMLRFVKYRHRFEKIENLAGYVFLSARNEMLRYVKKNKKIIKGIQNEIDVELFEASPNLIDKTHNKDEIQSALKKLPPTQYEVINLKIFQDFTFEEISKVLGTSINTVASRYRYAIEKLRNLLEKSYE